MKFNIDINPKYKDIFKLNIDTEIDDTSSSKSFFFRDKDRLIEVLGFLNSDPRQDDYMVYQDLYIDYIGLNNSGMPNYLEGYILTYYDYDGVEHTINIEF